MRKGMVQLDCGCFVKVITTVCDHYSVNLYKCRLVESELLVQQILREREQEREQERREESYWRSTAPIGSTQSFSLLKGGPNRRIQHGYDIRIWRYDRHHNLDYETILAWGVDEQLPDEWYLLQKDETVEYADIARNVERTKRIAQRRYRERYSRGNTKFDYWG